LGGKLSGIKFSEGDTGLGDGRRMWKSRRRRVLGKTQAAARLLRGQSLSLSVLGVTLPTILACSLMYEFSVREVNQIIWTPRGVRTVLRQ
jgi:hypothetical protein